MQAQQEETEEARRLRELKQRELQLIQYHVGSTDFSLSLVHSIIDETIINNGVGEHIITQEIGALIDSYAISHVLENIWGVVKNSVSAYDTETELSKETAFGRVKESYLV
jgi:hypothetical protein